MEGRLFPKEMSGYFNLLDLKQVGSLYLFRPCQLE